MWSAAAVKPIWLNIKCGGYVCVLPHLWPFLGSLSRVASQCCLPLFNAETASEGFAPKHLIATNHLNTTEVPFWAVYHVAGANGVSFKHFKSQLCSAQLKLLGMVVEQGGVGPDPARIRALQEWPPPRTKGQLREFFGSINWVRPFLGTAFSKAGYHLRQLLKKQVPDDFGDLEPKQRESFDELRRLAGEYTMLTVPDYEAAREWEKTGRPFEIFLDASLYGIGAMLAQVDKALMTHRPISFLARSLTPTQQAWPAWVRELWGMKEASQEFAPICGGYYTVLWTDHKNNTKISLMPADNCGEKVIRWWGEILRSGYHPRFTAGKINPSDGFSRNPVDREAVLSKRAELLRDPGALEREFSKAEYASLLGTGGRAVC